MKVFVINTMTDLSRCVRDFMNPLTLFGKSLLTSD